MTPTYTDMRQRRCSGCGALFLPPGAGNGACSDGCWVAARGRQRPQGEQLSRAWAAGSYRAERRVTAGVRVDAMLSAAAAGNDLKRHRAERRETLALIERVQGRARGESVISRSAAAAECTGPSCQVCAEGRRRDAARVRADAGYSEIYR